MKKDIHPTNYRHVVFEDLNDGTKILTRSTVASDETIKWTDGKEYPVVKVHISSSSHPFYTGQEKLVDIEGRVDKFKNRREAGAKAKAALLEKAGKAKKSEEKYLQENRQSEQLFLEAQAGLQTLNTQVQQIHKELAAAAVTVDKLSSRRKWIESQINENQQQISTLETDRIILDKQEGKNQSEIQAAQARELEEEGQ